MNIDYSDKIMDAFSDPKHVYSQEKEFSVMGYAGDTTIGEYVHLYFYIEKMPNYAESKILRAQFSVIGGVLLIAAAEKFCSLAEGSSFQDLIKYCDPRNGLSHILSAPEEKIYSINFVIQAFYKALETLTVS